MKKNLFLITVAALAFAACTNETTEYVGSNEPKEIAFSPLAQPNTRSAILDGTFPTDVSMEVAAWDVTNSRDFFGATTFSYVTSSSPSVWSGSKYWPLSPTTINFLAYANLTGSAVWDISDDGTSQKANGVKLTMTDNSSTQTDLMYGCGTGSVSSTPSGLTFPDKVSMPFKHAQALILFTAKAGDASSAGKIKINSITLNQAKYSGLYTVTHANYNAASGQAVTGAWASVSDQKDVVVPNWTGGSTALTTSPVNVGDGLMIVPDDNGATSDFANFTISYNLDGQDYTLTYTPTSTNVNQATKYTYDITFTLHEILIAPTVDSWTDGGNVNVTENNTFAANSTPAISIPSTAGTYILYVNGITGSIGAPTYTGSFSTNPAATLANGVATITFAVAANETGASIDRTITLTETGGGTSTTIITVTQAAP